MTIARLQHRIDASRCEPRTFVGVGSAFFSLEHTTPVTLFCGDDNSGRDNTERHPYNHTTEQPAEPKHHIFNP